MNAVSIRYTRSDIGAILDARRRAGDLEGQGEGAYFDFWFRITPDMLYRLMGSRIIDADGQESELSEVLVDDNGFVEPVLHRVAHRT